MIVEHDGARVEVDGRAAEIIGRILAGRDDIGRIAVGKLSVAFDGKRVHPIELTEKLIRRSAA